MRRTALAVLLTLAMLAGGAVMYGLHAYDQPGPLVAARDVLVPHGGADEVAEALGREGVITGPWLLQAAALLTRGNGTIRAGELAFPAGASPRQVLQVLRAGKPVQHYVTIPEGLTAAQECGLTPALSGARLHRVTAEEPAEGLRQAVEELSADVLVLLDPGHGWVSKLLGDGVIDEVLRHTQVPVLLLATQESGRD